MPDTEASLQGNQTTAKKTCEGNKGIPSQNTMHTSSNNDEAYEEERGNNLQSPMHIVSSRVIPQHTQHIVNGIRTWMRCTTCSKTRRWRTWCLVIVAQLANSSHGNVRRCAPQFLHVGVLNAHG